MNSIRVITISVFSLLAILFAAGGANAGSVIVEPTLLCIDGTAYAFKNLNPGDTIKLKAGARPYLLIRNFTGSLGKPMVFINYNGPVTINTDWYYGIVFRNCKYIKMTGTGYTNNYYGFMITRVQGGAGLSIGDLSSYTEIDHVYIDNVATAGIYAKTDPDCSLTSTRDKFTQYNTIIHNCFVGHTGDEGFYIGSSFYSGKTLACNGKDTVVLPHLMDGVKIYDNIVMHTGWDGIQVGSASKNCQIFNNVVMYDSEDGTLYQMSGILIGGGSQCDCYNNYIAKGKGDGIESLGLGDYRIFNNIIVDAGRNYYPNDPTKMKYGIYVNDNSARAGSSFSILFNDIINPKSNGVRFSSDVSRNNLIASNAIINPGQGSTGYIVVTCLGSNVAVRNNYQSMSSGGAGFIDTLYRLTPNSPLINNGYTDSRRVNFDFFNHQRPVGTRYDIGSYEYDPLHPNGSVRGEEVEPLDLTDSARSHFSVDPVPFPNPVSKNLTITFTTNEISNVELIIYDMRGSGFYHEDQNNLAIGVHNFKVDTESFPVGVCLFSIRTEKHTYTGKFYKVKE
ncbi:MAG: right-handed parallel beta-helix repeat-containing protein [Bacteroidetes bacterium]|nr:right-handed parallel beta-helix repeat-containing protein [Bacteroidota bacterium]